MTETTTTGTMTATVGLEFTSYASVVIEVPVGTTPEDIVDRAVAAYHQGDPGVDYDHRLDLSATKLSAIGDEEYPDAEWIMA